MLYTGIGLKKTGLVISMLKRANILSRSGHDVTIFTTSYNVEQDIVYRDMVDSGLLDREVCFVNMYDILLDRDCTCPALVNEVYQPAARDNYTLIPSGKSFLFRNEKEKKRYEIVRDDGTLSYVNFFIHDKIRARSKYDVNQILSCVQNINKDGAFESVYYFDRNRQVRIITQYDTKDGVTEINNIIIFNNDGTVEGMFSSEQELFIYMMNHLYNDSKMLYYFIIDRSIYFSDILFRNKRDNWRYIGTVHAAHYVKYNDPMSGINRHYASYFSRENRLDALVFLTQRQLKHANERFGVGNISVEIPHVYDKPVVDRHAERTPFSCISVGRYDVVKRYPDMVRIFARVVEKCPQATLKIYGYGSDEENIRKTIKELNLAEHVSLCQYTEDVDSLYQSSDLMLFTSRSEGYGLVIMEALANGCPVVSYDINYGPSEMIENGVNGYLVEDSQEELFARKVVSLLTDRAALKDMQSRCRETARKYTTVDFTDRWNELLKRTEKTVIRE
jgi:poly(glycerol-phosphate) alpha-glucosyltransferase